MKLAIISHTEHYRNSDGLIVGWGPTVREINHLLNVFEEIYHVAMLSTDLAPKSALPYLSDNIIFVPIDKVGGKSISNKLSIVTHAPKTLSIVRRTLRKVDCFQFRSPTGIGVYLIPYLTLFVKKKGWFKYAGNWSQENAPIGYAIQRSLLKNQNRIVTINGKWEDQPPHCLSFENPCLTSENVIKGRQIAKLKNLNDKINFCFVGRVEEEKGIGRIIEAFKEIANTERKRIGVVNIIGDGNTLLTYKAAAKECEVEFKFHGSLSNTEVFSIFGDSHFLLLPTTASEGFPKVIAEAMNFGCIPMVSNISSIGQYIKHGINGLLLNKITSAELLKLLSVGLNLNSKEYDYYINNQSQLVKKFTFTNYNDRIRKEIIKPKRV